MIIYRDSRRTLNRSDARSFTSATLMRGGDLTTILSTKRINVGE